MAKLPVRLSGHLVPVLLFGMLMGARHSHAQAVTVSLQGKVVDSQGKAIAGASVKVMDTPLAATSGMDGSFNLKGSFEVGIVRRATVPGGGRLEFRSGRLHLVQPASHALKVTLVAPTGKVARFPVPPGRDRTVSVNDVESWLGAGTGTFFLRLESAVDSRTFRLVRTGSGSPLLLLAGPGAAGTDADVRPASKPAAGPAVLVLDVSAAGHHGKRFAQEKPSQGGLSLALLPATAGLKERLQDFIGAGNTFRLAFLKKEIASSRKHIVHYADFSEISGDSLPAHSFPDSRGPESSPFGANVPSWSPDGRVIAYEIGAESQTTPASRIWLQPIQGARAAGPDVPSTNPRFWTDGKDTALIWCTSGKEDGWKDTASRTLSQKASGGTLGGEVRTLAKGSYHGGLSKDGRYLSTAFRLGVMLDLSTQERRFFHVYPGHPPAKDGSPTDSLQVCNPSISPDPGNTSRMMFLDFGIPPGDSAYPNMIRPRHYAQHQMILIGDYRSLAPGLIADFVDSPAEELAKEKTWDDPEWSNHPDFAVASTRDPDGDVSNPSEPRPTQPDIYLIHLPTKSSIKVLSADHMTMPALWIGAR